VIRAGAVSAIRAVIGALGPPLMLAPLLLPALVAPACATGRTNTIVIGSKNFTEQVILGEVLATLLEHRTALRVDRRFDLGGTFVCHKALLAGDLDIYVEYTGTALTAILKATPMTDPEAVYRRVVDEYGRRFALKWLPPLGFNNTFAMVVRPDDASRHSLKRISDLSGVRSTFRAGFGYEFMERADGYRGLCAAYGFEFAQRPKEMDLGLIYRALSERQVDVVAGNSTDGLIGSMGLVVLEDDRHYFPPYDAAPVASAAILELHPEVEKVLAGLAGRITEKKMRRMNHAVDAEKRSPADVAREFLAAEGLLDHR
jgi:glycine betaine/choline ABC-type transport system substrate-binding protein